MSGKGFLDSILNFADGAMSAAEQATGTLPAAPLPAGYQARAQANPNAGTRMMVQATRVPPFQIIEAIDPNGYEVWIVTNGVQQAECNSREFAERIYNAVR